MLPWTLISAPIRKKTRPALSFALFLMHTFDFKFIPTKLLGWKTLQVSYIRKSISAVAWPMNSREPVATESSRIRLIRSPRKFFLLATYGAGYSERPDSLRIFRFLFFTFHEESFFWPDSIEYMANSERNERGEGGLKVFGQRIGAIFSMCT